MNSILSFLVLSFSLNTLACDKDHTAKECPLAGNMSTKTYYSAKSKMYKKMLKKPKGEDHRACFQSKEEAEDLGFQPAKN